MGVQAKALELSSLERDALSSLVRAALTPQQRALRARMILRLAEGLSITETAASLGVWRKTVSEWRARWLASSGQEAPAADRLRDAPRSGARGGAPRADRQDLAAQRRAQFKKVRTLSRIACGSG